MTRRAWAAALTWAAAILIATSIPGSQLPRAFPHADKLVHLALYGVLGVLVARALGAGPPRARSRPATIGGWLGAIALFAALDEWHQDFVPGRSSDHIDWIADVIGATAGLVATTTFRSEQRT